LKKPRSSSPARVRQVGEATGSHAGIDWIMAALLAAAAVASALYFRVPFNFDVHSRDFNPFVLVPIVLGAFGLKFFVSALVATLRGRKYGESVLEVDAESVAPGETLRGRVRTATELRPTGDYEICIRCIEAVSRTRTRDAETTTTDVIHWEARLRVPADSVRSIEGIPFQFAIPESALTSGDPTAKGSVRWILEIRAPGPGLDFYALFGVDVRRRG
jgi:hypothetical protein